MVILALSVSAIFTLVFRLHFFTPPEEQLLNKLLVCSGEERESTYECTMPIIRNHMHLIDTNRFNNVLRDRFSDHGVAIRCHSIMHSFGRVLNEVGTSVQSALERCSSLCSSGCTMGVMESFLLLNTKEHITPKKLMIKSDMVCLSSAHGNIRYINECYHGIGHGLVRLYGYNMQDNAEFCKLLTNNQRPSCYAGVVMEVITPVDVTKRIPIDKTNPSQVCTELEDKELREVCMAYIPTLWKNNGFSREEREIFCANSGLSDSCIRGIGQLEVGSYLSTFDGYLIRYANKLKLSESKILYDALRPIFEDNKKPFSDFCSKLNDKLRNECK